MTAFGDLWKAVDAEARAEARDRWEAGLEPCCAYEAALFAEWDTERDAP